MPPAETESRRREGHLRTASWVGVLVTTVMLLLSSGTIAGADGPAMYHVARSIVEDGDLTVPPRLGFPGRNGEHYASHGLGLPVVSLVPYLVSLPIARSVAQPSEPSEAAVIALMPVVGGLLAASLYVLARRLGGGSGSSIVVALGGVFGTFLLPYLKDFYSEPLATLLVSVAIERAVAGRSGTSGLALGAAGITRPQTFVLSPVLVWRVWRQDGIGGAVRTAAPIACGLAVALTYNAVRFGDPLRFDPLQSSLELWPGPLEAVGGLLMLPTKSVLLFAPILILVLPALWRLRGPHPTAFWLLTANLALTFGVAILWPAWDGGWTWGPRLLLTGLVPAVAAVAGWMEGSVLRRRAAVALLVAGFLVSLPGVLASTRAQLLHRPPPRGPSVVRQYALLPDAARFTAAHLYEAGDPRRYLDTWQIGLARTAGPVGLQAATALSVVLAAVTILAARRLRRRPGAGGDR